MVESNMIAFFVANVILCEKFSPLSIQKLWLSNLIVAKLLFKPDVVTLYYNPDHRRDFRFVIQKFIILDLALVKLNS